MQTEAPVETPADVIVEIRPLFLSEFEKIAEAYRKASKEYRAGLDEVVEFPLRRLLERQCNYMQNLCREKVQHSLAETDWDLLEQTHTLKSLIFNNKAWREFSQKLKKGNYAEFPQLGQYAS
jgi:hypothetical protein